MYNHHRLRDRLMAPSYSFSPLPVNGLCEFALRITNDVLYQLSYTGIRPRPGPW